jgi:hypothetical protein
MLPPRPDSLRGHARLAWRVSAFGLFLAADLTLMAFACGGTTGEPPLAPATETDSSEDALLGDVGPGEAGPDATVGQDSGTGLYTNPFDVAIVYADRDLPEIAPAPEAGAEAGFPWPSCPPFIAVGPGHAAVAPGSKQWISGNVLDEVPADWTSDGGSTFAAAGSPCATYGWLGSTAMDECETMQSNTAQEAYVYFPPCNWCPAGSGAVGAGPYAGNKRDWVCANLYQCMMQSQCFAGQGGVAACLCGSESASACTADPHPPGPCADWEFSALEVTSAEDALLNYTTSGTVGQSSVTCGSVLNYTIGQAVVDGCIVPEASTP